ncbi:MAG: EI24 domain-containing protein [Rhodoferax sp.]|nr:EI24 domain-containing protein [Rhodoferax sp.]
MKLWFDALGRALACCLHPRVLLLSLAPLFLAVLLALGLGLLYWDAALDGVLRLLEASDLLSAFWGWLERAGMGQAKALLAPLLVIFLATPVIAVFSLLLVSMLATPALTRWVAARRFPDLERRQGASWLGGLVWALGSTALALLALLASMPLWLVPPLVLLLPPLIWGWLTYRVMAYDTLAEHADPDERRDILRRHRGRLLAMGVACGLLGSAPGLIWASGTLAPVVALVLVPVTVWIYTAVFALSSLWFAHYTLAVLHAKRQADPPARVLPTSPPVCKDDPP